MRSSCFIQDFKKSFDAQSQAQYEVFGLSRSKLFKLSLFFASNAELN